MLPHNNSKNREKKWKVHERTKAKGKKKNNSFHFQRIFSVDRIEDEKLKQYFLALILNAEMPLL